jgi:hypothetical protein
MSKLNNVVKVMHRGAGNGRLTSSRAAYLRVVREYIDGDVMVEGSEEVWQVRPSKDSKAQWETYIPAFEQ